MSLKAQIEAIIYAAETPVTVEQIAHLVKDTVRAKDATLDDAAVNARASVSRRVGG